MRIYKLNKSVLSIKNNAAQFLKGLTSNDLQKPANAFLNIHGRIIATFDQAQTGQDEYLVLIERPFVQDVLKHIERYAKLSGTQIAQLERNVYFDLEDQYRIGKDEWVIAQKKGKLVVTDKKLEPTVPQEEFTLFRVKNDIPQHGVDYKDEMLLNINMVDFVSFTKGCYLGQEPISKVYNRSKPTWKLCVRHEDECTVEEKGKMTSRIQDPDTGKAMGFIFLKNE